MGSFLRGVASAIGGIAGRLLSFLPGPPATSRPPDIDGRRPMAVDPVEALQANLNRKDGHGGFN
jgi:hypothetical protein